MSGRFIDNEAFVELSRILNEAMEEHQKQEEDVWESLDVDMQLDVFCAIIRKLKKAELEDGRSYRGVLYDEFGFDLDSYVRAQSAGFLEIHNSITSKSDIYNILESFAESCNISVTKDQILNHLKKMGYM